MAPEVALTGDGPRLPSESGWRCPRCGGGILDLAHAAHWWHEEARRHIRWARTGGAPSCTGTNFPPAWHLGQARQAREYARNVAGMMAGRPNRYAEKKKKGHRISP